MNVFTAPPELLSDPEALAMMQAFYSRSKRGIQDRLAETTLDIGKIKDKLAQFYVGYGHDSIGQCGYTTFFLEDVSILAAKAIQNNVLYDGQESSTRYIDFSTSGFYSASPELNALQQKWLDLYNELLTPVYQALVQRFGDASDPEGEHVQESLQDPMFLKACKAKAFDIVGAFLPTGVRTNLSWTTSLATANRELSRLYAHPLLEVKMLAAKIEEEIRTKYPSVYQKGGLATHPNTQYLEQYGTSNYDQPITYDGLYSVKLACFNENLGEVNQRPKYARLPSDVHNSVFVGAEVVMDYRSFRDIQRHRTLAPSSPLIHLWGPGSRNLDKVFGSWYLSCLDELDLLTEDLCLRITNLIKEVGSAPGTDTYKQYAYPMGIKVSFSLKGYIGDWLYVCELRSGDTVHPTVRAFATAIWSLIENAMKAQAPRVLLHLQPNIKPFDLTDMESQLRPLVKRAQQDIVQKQ